MSLKVSNDYIIDLVLVKLLYLSSLLSLKKYKKIIFNMIEYLLWLAITFEQK